MRRGRSTLLAMFGVVSAAIVSLASFVTYSLFIHRLEPNDDPNGEVSLRAYYQRGKGTSFDPFIIARPRHFYNLTRLHNLGVYGSRTYFSLGYDPVASDEFPTAKDGQVVTLENGTQHTVDLKFFASDTDLDPSHMVKYLDMSTANYGQYLSIGSEGSPFYGSFEGNGLEIRNLQVASYPEDVGVFGYTYHASVVQNIFFDNLTVADNGYDSAVNDLNTIYGTINWADYGGLSYIPATGDPTSITNIVANKTFTYAANDSFVATIPTGNNNLPDMTYHYRCSTDYLTIGNINQQNHTCPIDINISNITANSALSTVENARISCRLSLIGTIALDGIKYSRVLRTYKFYFDNISGAIKISQVIDYNDGTGNENYTNYSHGNNIGFIAGHCDGSLRNAYIHNGTLAMNQESNVDFVKIAQESETGFVGEVGPATENTYVPHSNDTGVVNFTKMYSDIAGGVTFTKITGATARYREYNSNNYYAYVPKASTSTVYMDVLRRTPLYETYGDDANTKFRISGKDQSVDFSGLTVIEDEDDANRGLGVFSLVTADIETNASNNFDANLGAFAITKEASDSKKLYYTTAEYRTENNNEDITKWTNSGAQYHLDHEMTLPEYVSDETFAQLERHKNWNIECTLQSNEDAGGYNYFADAKNDTFIHKYFKYKLRNDNNEVLSDDSQNLGLFIKQVDNASGETSNITAFNTYLSMAKPGSFNPKNDESKPYHGAIPGTIQFEVYSSVGNVTVIAGSGSGFDNFVGVWKKIENAVSYPATQPDYAMYVPSSTSGPFPYFRYKGGHDVNGNKLGVVQSYTDTTAGTGVNGGSSNENDWDVAGEGQTAIARLDNTVGQRLFAHTFCLPKGKYFIASPRNTVKIYYVAAQGQIEGNTGTTESIYDKRNIIENIDFIKASPFNGNPFNLESSRMYLSLSNCNFGNSQGRISVTYDTSNNCARITADKSGNDASSHNVDKLTFWNQHSESIRVWWLGENTVALATGTYDRSKENA